MSIKLLLKIPLALYQWFCKAFHRRSRYTITFLGLNTTIWSIALVGMALLPNQYVSKWTLILPGAGIGSKVDIDNIGSASAVVNSAFSSHALSPKVNYKSIAQSSKVLGDAATSIDLSVGEFGKPQINLVDQTALLYFNVADTDPEVANKKSWALYNALQKQINNLREDEILRREQSVQKMLKTFGKKLNLAKKNLLDYQSQSDIVTIEQFKRIPLLIEEMRAQHVNLSVEKEQVLQELLTLSRILGLTSAEASNVMSLQADPFFQNLVAQHSEASTMLANYSSKWGDNHHKVKEQRLSINATESAMQSRAIALIGSSRIGNAGAVQRMSLSNHNKRSDLFYDLIAKKSEYEGIKTKVNNLEQQIGQYQTRMRLQSENVSKLDELEREHQIAEAVFTSAVAKIDTGKSDLFASYPMLQMMMEPTMPKKRSGARPEHILLGAGFGTVMTIVILTLLWFRRRQESSRGY